MENTKINRIEVIDETGRILVLTNVTVKISLQDNQETMKLFVSKEEKDITK